MLQRTLKINKQSKPTLNVKGLDKIKYCEASIYGY